MDKTTAWLILNMVRGIGPASIRKLMEIYNDPREILESSDKIPQGILQPDSLRQLREWRNLPWEKEIERTKSYGIKIICLDDSEYPDSLRQIQTHLRFYISKETSRIYLCSLVLWAQEIHPLMVS